MISEILNNKGVRAGTEDPGNCEARGLEALGGGRRALSEQQTTARVSAAGTVPGDPRRALRGPELAHRQARAALRTEAESERRAAGAVRAPEGMQATVAVTSAWRDGAGTATGVTSMVPP